jgi:hypothetical protein
VFAPYRYLGSRQPAVLSELHLVLAFIIAGPDGNAAWDGKYPLANEAAGSDGAAFLQRLDGEIARLRAKGGDIAISFGGEGGQELALTAADAPALESNYETVIDRYRLTWMDLDVEGDALANRAANERRNRALAALQARHPDLRITFTLPVEPDGLSPDSLSLLQDAAGKGVRIAAVNLMIMDYAPRFLANGDAMGALGIRAAQRAHAQCTKWAPKLAFGLTPMIGANDELGQYFTTGDATAVCAWARKQPWICWLSYWSLNRDDGSYARIFRRFSTR